MNQTRFFALTAFAASTISMHGIAQVPASPTAAGNGLTISQELNSRFDLKQLRTLPAGKLPNWIPVKSNNSSPKGAKLHRDKVIAIATEVAPKLNPHSAEFTPGGVAYSRDVNCWFVYFKPTGKRLSNDFAILIHDSDNSTELIPGQ